MHLEAVRARIEQAAKRAGRDPSVVRIVAVTKTHPIGVVREAAAEGLLDIGENRVQEALAKQEEWPDAPVRWHLIGHLQRNKAKLAAGCFALIHSLDSVRLADALEHAAAAKNLVQDVLVQVNVAREPQKDGAAPEEVDALVAHAAAQAHLRLLGLMTIAPLTDDVSVIRRTFGALRELRERMQGAHALRTTHPWELSMGMSADFEIAVEEGATLLRLGTILFGERHP
jgi:PLP dependent protein